jgi:hypothetical protein
MKRPGQSIGTGLRGDRGIAVPMFAIGIVAIMGLTALSVDLGWLYFQRDRTQAAADAAALAGVTALPGFPDLAVAEARRVAASNGYEHGVDGTVVETRPLAAQKLEATITKPVDTFFLKVLGFDSMTIKRRAVAEYATQLPMGSPENYLGGPDGGAKPLYLAVNGPGTNYQSGDPQSVTCAPRTFTPPDIWGPDCEPGRTNPDYDPSGYFYAVEVAAGATSIQVQLFDPWGYNRRISTSYPQPYDGSASDVHTRFTLYEVDDTPFNPDDNTNILCQTTYTGGPNGPTDPPVWTLFCDQPITRAGLYPLQVEAESGSGVNLFAMKAFTPGSATPPRMYGLGEMSVAAYQLSNADPEFYLAEVAEFHGGRTLQIELFDAGDAEDAVYIQILRPDGTPAPTCTWSTRTQPLSGSEDNADGDGCTIDAHGAGQAGSGGSQGRFNEDWLDVRIPIPNGYTCEPGANGCWWKIKIIADNPRDRTTWHAKVTGVPIHLVHEPAAAP